jgi:hypothetical protein
MKDRLNIASAIADYRTGVISLTEGVDEILRIQNKSTRFNLNSFVLGFALGFILLLVSALIIHELRLI